MSGMYGNCEGPRAACTVAAMPVSQPLGAPLLTDARGDGRFDVGIAGAGQLARMTCLAAWPLGIRVAVLGGPHEPAAPMAAGLVEGDWHDADAVRALGAAARVVTLENEFVDAGALASVQAAGTPVRPGADALARVQDKALQKELVRAAGLPTAPSVVLDGARDVAAAGRELGWPLMLKARRLGYDGYGNATCHDEDSARAAFARLDAGEGVLAEGFVTFTRELAVMVARAPGGGRAAYPVVETVQRNHVCHEVVAPAPIVADARDRAREVALAAAEAAEGLGVTGVEMFLVAGGGVLVNELAPRPAQLGPLHDRGLRDLAVREPPARRAGPAPGRRGHARAGRGDGEPARAPAPAPRGPTSRRPWRSRGPTCTSTTRPRCGRAARWAT